MTDNKEPETSRSAFLVNVYNQIIDFGYNFVSTPDFRSFKHGNLKFTDERLIFKSGTNKIIITLEHYHIKREGWHPVYWGLQSFDHNDNAISPFSIPCLQKIIDQMECCLKNNGKYETKLNLTEPKYGWFAWNCFRFSEITSDLDDLKMTDYLNINSGEAANRLITELSTYIECWKNLILEL